MKKTHKPKLLIICKQQFGTLSDVYKWCEHLAEKYAVTVVSFDVKQDKVSVPGVRLIYIPYYGPRIIRGIRFVICSTILAFFFKGSIIVSYFAGCESYKRLCPRKRMILDIRTLDVSDDSNIRKANDSRLKECALLYDYVTVISDGIRRKIAIPEEKCSVVPLGGDFVPATDRRYDNIRLIYVGTLDNRHIDITLKGLSLAIERGYVRNDIRYDILGGCPEAEFNKLKELVAALHLERNVVLHGYVRHNLISSYLERSNIGVSFIPQTEYYDLQPPTKTYEYILAGLFTIATSTSANKEIVNDNNGILIDDNEEAFALALEHVSRNMSDKDPVVIQNTLLDFTWDKIVANTLIPVLEKG